MALPRPILTDLSDAALTRASIRNEVDFLRFLRRAPAVQAMAQDGIEAWRTPVDFTFLNGAHISRDARATGENGIQLIVDFFKRTKCAKYMIWLDEKVDEESWKPWLAAKGFAYDLGSPCLALPLDELPAQLPLPTDFRVERIRDYVGITYWSDTFVAGFGFAPETANGMSDMWNGLGLERPLATYLGYLGDEAVATSALFYGAGVAGIQCVATIPSQRGKGFGAAMTLAPLYDARADGWRAGVLSASKMGLPVYKRLGFRVLGNLSNYYLRD